MSIGFWQLVLILLIVLLVFGAGKLPRVMGDLGKGMRSLREGMKEESKPSQLSEVEKEKPEDKS